MDLLSLRKKTESSSTVYKNSCLKILKSLNLGLFLGNVKNITKTSINIYAETGSSCRASLSNLKYFIVFPKLMTQDS